MKAIILAILAVCVLTTNALSQSAGTEKAMEKAEKQCVEKRSGVGERGFVSKEVCRREREIKTMEGKQKDYIREHSSGVSNSKGTSKSADRGSKK